MIKRVFIILSIALLSFRASAQMVTVKSDVIKDIAMIPNLGLELVVGNKTTIGFDAFLAYKSWGKDVKITGADANYKYWFNGRPFTRQYIGATMQFSNHQIVWNRDRHYGNSFGAGMIFGHVINLSTRLNIELSSGLLFMGYREKRYKEGDAYEMYHGKVNNTGFLLVPKLEVSVSYILR